MSPRTYPGTATPMDDDLPWDTAPRMVTVNGADLEFFTIGHLSDALGKRPVTVRKWITMGVIPEAQYRLRVQRAIKGQGPRLWTRQQVEAIVRIATEEGMIGAKNNRSDRQNAEFTRRVFEWFAANKGKE